MIYSGPLDLTKMTPEVKQAYQIWGNQKTAVNTNLEIAGRHYTSREFITWWLENLSKKKWKKPTCGRLDHAKGYKFGNIEMQELADNVKERNDRLGNPGRTSKPVYSVSGSGKDIRRFRSKTEASIFYGINVKTVYNLCQNKWGISNYGPSSGRTGVTFRWA